MKFVFVSNFYNHHQQSFSGAMYRLTNGAYRFIATMPFSQERLDMGWEEKKEPFVLHFDDDPKKCQKLIDSAEAVIFGNAPEVLIHYRLKNKKLVLKYSERLYKTKPFWYTIPLRRIINYFRWERYNSMYLLCASAYAAADYALTGNFCGKAYKWGYFTEIKRYDNIETLFDKKRENPAPSILWAGRLLEWKHPDSALHVAKKLRDNGYDFEMNIIGNGELIDTLRKLLADYELENKVHLLGPKKPNEVRSYMERADIYLFTSDRREGWGAVLNESMNSGCAVIANKEIGSVPYLLDHNVNGLIYSTEDELYEYVARLIEDHEIREKYGRNAYKTISEQWNAEVAATRLCEALPYFQKSKSFDKYSDGPLAKE